MGVLFLTQIAQITQITMRGRKWFERAGGTDGADENMKRLKHEMMKILKAIRCSLLRWTNDAEPFARQTSA